MNNTKYQDSPITFTVNPKDGFVDLDVSLDLNKCFDIISSSMWHVCLSWRDGHQSEVSEVDSIAQCMLQMMILKARTFKMMMEGVPLLPNKTDGRKVLDIPSLATIIRSIYEFAFLFHNIFVHPENNEERNVLVYIWKIRGFNNRANQIMPEQFKKKQNAELDTINEYKQKAKAEVDKFFIKESAKKKLDKAIDSSSCLMSGFRFEKDETNCIIDFTQISFTNSKALFEHDYYAILYNFLSSNSHPSFLGVLQFGQMYDNDMDKEYLKSYFWIACICMSKFIRDFCMTVSDGQIIKERVIGPGWNTINFFSEL